MDADIFRRGNILDPTADERARAAVKAFRAMQPQLSAYARVLTKRANARVEMAARDNGSTDGTRIFFRPPIGLGDKTPHKRTDCDKRNEFRQLLCPACKIRETVLVTIYHEIAHIAFDSFEPPSVSDQRKLIREGVKQHGGQYADAITERLDEAPAYMKSDYKTMSSLISKFLPIIINAMEDARVNQRMFSARQGTKVMFDADTWAVFTEGVENKGPDGVVRMNMWTEAKPNMQVIVGLFCKASGYDYSGWFSPEVVDALNDAHLTGLIAKLTTVRAAGGVYALAFPVLARLRELGYCLDDLDPPEPKPEPEPEEEPEPEPEPQPEGESDDESEDTGDDGDNPQDPDDDSDSNEDGKPSSESGDSEDDSDSSESGGDSGSSPDESTASEESGSDSDPAEADSGGDVDDSDDSSDSSEGLPSDSPSSGDQAGDSGDSESQGDQDLSGSSEPGSAGDGTGDGGDTADDTREGDIDENSEGSDEVTEGTPESGGEAGPSDSGESESSEGDSSRDDSREGGEAAEGTGGDGLDSDSDLEDSDDESETDVCSENDPVSDALDPAGSDDRSSGTAGEPTEDELGDVPSDASQTEAPESGASQGSTRPPGDVGKPEAFEPGDEPIDTGADDGQGGTSIIEDHENDDKPIDMGTAEEAGVALLKWGDHEEKPKSVAEQKKEDDENAVVDRAIVQGIYFETPSRNIYGVREHHYGEPVIVSGVDMSRAWSGWDEEEYAAAVGKVGEFKASETVLGPALLKMRTTFEANARGGIERNRKAGKVDHSALGKRAPLNDPKMFSKKTRPGKRDYFVLIGIDVSGSTAGRNILLSKQAAFAQAELCQRMGIKFAVYAHSGNYHDPGSGRLGIDLDIYHIKDADEPWNSKVQERLTNLGPDSANLDGHTIEYYRKILDRRPETDKVMLYYSDGKMPAENHDEELEILQREIKTCRHKGYTLMGVGIRTDSPARHGLETVQVDTSEDIGKVIVALRKRLIATRRD